MTDIAETATAAVADPSVVTVKRLDSTSVELEIPIAAEAMAQAQDRAFRELVKNVRIPGFRPGKAPRKVFEAAYGAQGITERAFERVVPSVYSQALRDNDLEPVDEPQMEMLPVEDGQPLRFRATVSVRPHFELGTYKGIAAEVEAGAVTDEQVEQALSEVRRDAATFVPVDRPVALGDTATLDYEGKIDGVPFEGGKAEGQPSEILEERFIPGFATGVVGMTAGETKDIEATFPEGYQNEELAGKQAVFTITVHDVKAPELPPLDDELAQRYKPGSTLDDLRKELRERLEGRNAQRVRRVLQGKVMDALLAAHEFALPAVMVEREVDSLLEEAKSYVTRAGLEWDKYLGDQSKTADDLRADYRVEAERRVKSGLLLEQIAKAESIQASEQDIEAEIASLSAQYRQPREAIVKMLQPNFGALVDGIVRTKTLDFVVDHAAVTETAPAAEVALPVEAAAPPAL